MCSLTVADAREPDRMMRRLSHIEMMIDAAMRRAPRPAAIRSRCAARAARLPSAPTATRATHQTRRLSKFPCQLCNRALNWPGPTYFDAQGNTLTHDE
jgi:hypothetical protein